LKEYSIDDLELEISLVALAVEVYGNQDELERKGTLAAIDANEAKKDAGEVDVSFFPSDVQCVVLDIWKHWKVYPPGRKSKSFSSWIECCRDIVDASGEYGVSRILELVYYDYKEREYELGRVPYIVSGPCSFVKVVRAKAAQIREKEDTNVERANDGQSSFHF
jgi:hypothetical protein